MKQLFKVANDLDDLGEHKLADWADNWGYPDTTQQETNTIEKVVLEDVASKCENITELLGKYSSLKALQSTIKQKGHIIQANQLNEFIKKFANSSFDSLIVQMKTSGFRSREEIIQAKEEIQDLANNLSSAEQIKLINEWSAAMEAALTEGLIDNIEQYQLATV